MLVSVFHHCDPWCVYFKGTSRNPSCVPSVLVEQAGQSGANLKIEKSTASHSYGAGAMNLEAQTNVPKVKENLGYGKSELAGQSAYGSDAVNLQATMNAPKPKTEGLGHVDKKQEAKT